MSRSTRDSAATRGLLARVDSRSTGKLAVGAGAVEVAIHLLHGDVVAATAADDDRQVVRMLLLRGTLDVARAEGFETRIDAGGDVFGELLDLGLGEELDLILRERFRQNLCDYLSSASTPKFFEQRGVFASNIQMGHDSRALVAEVCQDCDLAIGLDPDAVVIRGDVDPGPDPERQAVADLVSDEPQTVASLLHELAAEPTRAKVLVARLLADGVLSEPAAEPADVGETDLADVPFEDDDTVSTDRSALDQLRAEMDDEESRAAVSNLADEGTNGEPAGATNETPVPSKYAAWMGRTSNVDAEDLEFFEDHDHDRGSDQRGRFSLEDHHLDKVQVAEMATPADTEVLEADEAPAVKFGAPALSEDEALAKIAVANEVLSAVARAFDAAEGAGRGRAAVQLLVDGVPSQFAALLHDLTISEQGQLPDGPLLHNLAVRPPSEHRHLLNGSLVDIVERALSSAADELPEESLDDVLASVAGYRQRLGL